MGDNYDGRYVWRLREEDKCVFSDLFLAYFELQIGDDLQFTESSNGIVELHDDEAPNNDYHIRNMVMDPSCPNFECQQYVDDGEFTFIKVGSSSLERRTYQGQQFVLLDSNAVPLYDDCASALLYNELKNEFEGDNDDGE
jgi:hypothetical protein